MDRLWRKSLKRVRQASERGSGRVSASTEQSLDLEVAGSEESVSDIYSSPSDDDEERWLSVEEDSWENLSDESGPARLYSSSDESDLRSDLSSEMSSILSDKTQTVPESSATPLFPDSQVSSDEFSAAFMSLAQRHNLTYSSLTDILKLLLIVLPAPSNVPSSATTLMNKFANFKKETMIQHFCSCCTEPLMPGSMCTKSGCTGELEQHSVFVQIPLHMQLKDRFEGTTMLCSVFSKQLLFGVTVN